MATTIEFYKVYFLSSEKELSISQYFNNLVGRTHIYDNSECPRDLHQITKLNDGMIGGVFRKFRADKNIEYGQVGADGQLLEFKDDEGLLETNHFVYFPEHDIIGYIRNKHANTYSKFRECLSSLFKAKIGLLQLVHKQALESLLKNKQVVKMSCSMQVSPLAVYSGDNWSNRTIDALSSSGATDIEFTISIQKSPQGSIFNLMENITDLLLKRPKKLIAGLRDDDDQISVIDLLGNKIVYTDEIFSYTKEKVGNNKIYEKIIYAYQIKENEIIQAVRAYQMANL